MDNQTRMLLDNDRVLGYEAMITDKLSGSKKKRILDLGSGSGILSFLAAKTCPNSTIIGIEKDEYWCSVATALAKKNNLENVEFICENIFEYKPEEKFDVIIQEQIGIHIWNEHLDDIISYAKENLLNEGGIVLPDRVNMVFYGGDTPTERQRCYDLWSTPEYLVNVIDMSYDIQKERYLDPQLEHVRDLNLSLKRLTKLGRMEFDLLNSDNDKRKIEFTKDVFRNIFILVELCVGEKVFISTSGHWGVNIIHPGRAIEGIELLSKNPLRFSFSGE